MAAKKARKIKSKHVKPLGTTKGSSKKLVDCYPAVHLPGCNSAKSVDPCKNSCQDSCKWSCQSMCKYGCKGNEKAPPPPKSKKIKTKK